LTAFAFIMANAAAGYSLGDISSLLFSADASAAPLFKKEKQAAPHVLAKPFAALAKTSDNAFAETARAQEAAGMRRKDAGEEKLQAAEAMGAADISDPVVDLLAPPRIVYRIPSPLQILKARSTLLPPHLPGCIPRVAPATAPRLHPAPLLQLQYSRVKLQPPPSVALFQPGSSCE
jgi:hypothetical protein